MISGLATITIADENYSEHVAFELDARNGLIFGAETVLQRARKAKRLYLSLMTSKRKLRIRVSNVESSCANFVIVSEEAPLA
jgi:hypothetical protein